MAIPTNEGHCIIPFKHHGGATILVHREPTKGDIEKLPVLNVTDSSTEWRPTTLPTYEKHEKLEQQDFKIKISQRIIQDRQTKGLRMNYVTQTLQAAKNWPADKIEKWSARLGYVPNELVKATLLNTTYALIMDTDEPSHSIMKRRMKRRFPFPN